jgi:hypothetical protein
MTWTTPKTFTAGMVITETDLNAYLRDDLNALKNPPFQQIVTASATGWSTTASTAVPVNTALNVALNTNGGDVQCYFYGWCVDAGAMFNLDYDGTAFTDRLSGLVNSRGEERLMQYHVWVTGLASGLHTFRPTWRSTGQQVGLDMSAHPVVFWAREG